MTTGRRFPWRKRKKFEESKQNAWKEAGSASASILPVSSRFLCRKRAALERSWLNPLQIGSAHETSV